MNHKTQQDNLYYRKLVEEAILNANGRDIAIWGTKEDGRKAKEVLESLGGTCKFFVSSRPRTDTCYGVPLLTPDILDVKKHYVLLATQSKEVEQFLRNSGYRLDGPDCIHAFTLWHEDIEYHGCFVGAGTSGYEYLSPDFGWLIKKIGRYCSINHTARVVPNHPLDLVATNGILYSLKCLPTKNMRTQAEKSGIPTEYIELLKKDRVEIGNDVWIGMNVVIVPGVKIGDGAVLGAGAVVTKDVEPYAIMGGVPAKIIRYRYPKEIIEAFLRIKWWDWSIEKIEENFELFYDPEKFCKMFDPPIETGHNIN